METTKIQTTQHGKYSITTDPEKFTVLITRPSKSTFKSVQVVEHVRFTRAEDIPTRWANMQAFVEKFMGKQAQLEEAKKNKRIKIMDAKQHMEAPFSVGDILYESFGYDQTNVYFHQVVNTTKATIWIRQIGQERTYTNSDQGTTVPLKDKFVGDDIVKKRISVFLSDAGPRAHVKGMYKWDGRPKFWSSYH